MAALLKLRLLCEMCAIVAENIEELQRWRKELRREFEAALRQALPEDLVGFADEFCEFPRLLSIYGEASVRYVYNRCFDYGGGADARGVRRQLKQLQAVWPIEFTTKEEILSIRIHVRLKGSAKRKNQSTCVTPRRRS